jgi:hypothetical protein
MTRFFNPYAHVQLTQGSDRRDGPPPGHAVHGEDLYSATLPITITAQTPLLLPDLAGRRKTPGQADTVDMRTDPDGALLVLGSSIKGMLRHYYETATNSRLGVVSSDHSARPLAIRRPATNAVGVPAIVTQVDKDKMGIVSSVHLEMVHDLYSKDDEDIDFQPGVWLPRDLGERLLGKGTSRAERHGKIVWALLHPFRSPATDLKDEYFVWRASALAWKPEKLDLKAAPWKTAMGTRELVTHVSPIVVKAQIHWPTGGALGHDERLVALAVLKGQPGRADVRPITLGAEAVLKWDALIASYRRAHATERDLRSYSLFVDPQTDWSLRPGMTVFIERPDNPDRARLHPVMIGRDVFDVPPADFIPPSHRHATDLSQFSPADRVFGWVSQGGEGLDQAAYRAHLRVDAPSVGRKGAPANPLSLARPMMLQALNSPKPSQYRFYLGLRAGGNTRPLPSGQPKSIRAGYSADAVAERIVRGRKYYVHDRHLLSGQPIANDYWSPQEAARQQHASVSAGDVTRHREFTAAPGQPPAVSLRISGWMPVGTTIRTTIRLESISRDDLLPLLALLTSSDDLSMRLGFGKPLGFGVVRVELDRENARIESHDEIVSRYSSLSSNPSEAARQTTNALIASAKSWFADHDAQPHVEQLKLVMRGMSSYPVHYPRESMTREAKTYLWWVTNDKSGKYAGQGLSQPLLADGADGSLPYKPGPRR